MDKIIDFSNCRRAHAAFGGTDRKFGVIYNGSIYMLKFSEHHAKQHDISTSYVNNVVSEYISSHIAQSTGLPVHETVIGTYNDEIVVGCKDFRENSHVSNIEFSEYVRAKYDSKDVKRIVLLDQIYGSVRDPQNDIPPDLQEETIERYWDTFVIDALVGNFDRHIGNWGYLVEDNELRLAPIYDFGSTLFPQMSDKGALDYMSSEFEMMRRSLVFPSPVLAITKEKVGKVGYYDMMASNYDSNCTAAVLRIVPRINMERVEIIIDETPFITDVRKDFYKKILNMRKALVLDRAYLRCLDRDFDQDTASRLTEGHQFSDDDLRTFMAERREIYEYFQENEKQIAYSKTDEYVKSRMLDRSAPEINRKELLAEQKDIMKQYGFQSKFVWSSIRARLKTHDTLIK